MITNIENIIAEVKKQGATVITDVKVKHVSFYPAKKGKNVDYWCSLTLDRPVPASIPNKFDENGNAINWIEGLSKTIIIPFGLATTLVFEGLFDMEDDYTEVVVGGKTFTAGEAAEDLSDYKEWIIAEAKKEALTDDEDAVPSHLHQLLNRATINVICRPVKKGKIKSLFSLNAKDVDVDRDSIWHDPYNATGIRVRKIVETLEAAKKAAADKKNTENNAKVSAFDKIVALYKDNGASNAVANL